MHNGENHWLTLSTVGLQESTAIINVYDSLYTSLSTSTKEQICALLCTMNSSIDVRFIDANVAQPRVAQSQSQTDYKLDNSAEHPHAYNTHDYILFYLQPTIVH